MSARSFHPRTESLDGRCLLSGIPALTISSVAPAEGSGGQTAFVFTVNLSAPSSKRISVDYRSTDASATAGLDYQAVSGKLHFAPGETTRTITVWVAGDTAAETDESFFMGLPFLSAGRVEKGLQSVGHLTDLLDRPTDRLRRPIQVQDQARP